MMALMAIAKVAIDRSMCIGVIIMINVDNAKLRIDVVDMLTKMADILKQITFLRKMRDGLMLLRARVTEFLGKNLSFVASPILPANAVVASYLWK